MISYPINMQHSPEDKPCTETFFKHCWGVFCFQNGSGYCMSQTFGKTLLHLWRRGFLKSVKGQWWVFIWEKGQELALTMIVTANRPPRGERTPQDSRNETALLTTIQVRGKTMYPSICWGQRGTPPEVYICTIQNKMVLLTNANHPTSRVRKPA